MCDCYFSFRCSSFSNHNMCVRVGHTYCTSVTYKPLIFPHNLSHHEETFPWDTISLGIDVSPRAFLQYIDWTGSDSRQLLFTKKFNRRGHLYDSTRAVFLRKKHYLDVCVKPDTYSKYIFPSSPPFCVSLTTTVLV